MEWSYLGCGEGDIENKTSNQTRSLEIRSQRGSFDPKGRNINDCMFSASSRICFLPRKLVRQQPRPIPLFIPSPAPYQNALFLFYNLLIRFIYYIIMGIFFPLKRTFARFHPSRIYYPALPCWSLEFCSDCRGFALVFVREK